MAEDVFRIAAPSSADADELADVLQACVGAGAAVSFVMPFGHGEARAFFTEKVFPAVAAGGCRLYALRVDGRIRGTVQMWVDLPPNQPHRGEVAKLLVHPEARRRGLGRTLMAALEADARTLGRTLITLDTRTDSNAYPLYRGMGYEITGEVPGFAVNPDGDGLHPTTYMYKQLQPSE